MKTSQGNYKNLRTKTCINNWKLKKYLCQILKYNKSKKKSKLHMYQSKEHVNKQKNKSDIFNKKPNKLMFKLKCLKGKSNKKKNSN